MHESWIVKAVICSQVYSQPHFCVFWIAVYFAKMEKEEKRINQTKVFAVG